MEGRGHLPASLPTLTPQALTCKGTWLGRRRNGGLLARFLEDPWRKSPTASPSHPRDTQGTICNLHHQEAQSYPAQQ